MISILVIRRQSPVVIHLHDMEKLKDMVILRANACATLMVVGTFFIIFFGECVVYNIGLTFLISYFYKVAIVIIKMRDMLYEI